MFVRKPEPGERERKWMLHGSGSLDQDTLKDSDVLLNFEAVLSRPNLRLELRYRKGSERKPISEK